MTNKSSPWLERQRRDRAGPKVLTPEEAEAAGLPLTDGAVSYHVYSGVRHTMTESDLWVGGDFSAIPVSLDAKLSDGSPRFIKRPDGTWFDLYGKTSAGTLEDFAEMELRIKAEFLEDIAKIESWTKARLDAYRTGLDRDEAQKELDSAIGKFNYACNAVSELQADLNAVTAERNALRDALAKFTDPDVTPTEPPINRALRVKIGDPRRMGP